MKIYLVTPAPLGSQKGNRVTAERWACLLQHLGHNVYVVEDYHDQQCDLLIALHAFKSYSSIRRFRNVTPHTPLILCLTGTDLYGDIHTQPEARESLELATRLVLLQPFGIAELPESLRSKARVIYQSVPTPLTREPPRSEVFEVCVLGHLRRVKDPFRTALAARRLPDSSQVLVLQVGGALDTAMAEQAQAEVAANPRYRWLGELSRGEALRVLSRCRLLSLTSEQEGGANVISEALAAQVPVVSSRIPGSLGLLGEDYLGYFPFGDTQALAHLLMRTENDPVFYQKLRQQCAQRRPLFEPACEERRWRELLQELVLEEESG